MAPRAPAPPRPTALPLVGQGPPPADGGPAALATGFRPFFVLAALSAVVLSAAGSFYVITRTIASESELRFPQPLAVFEPSALQAARCTDTATPPDARKPSSSSPSMVSVSATGRRRSPPTSSLP